MKRSIAIAIVIFLGGIMAQGSLSAASFSLPVVKSADSGTLGFVKASKIYKEAAYTLKYQKARKKIRGTENLRALPPREFSILTALPSWDILAYYQMGCFRNLLSDCKSRGPPAA